MSDRLTQSAVESAKQTRCDEWEYPFVRELAREAGITRPVSDEDAQAVLDWVAGDPDPDYRPLPNDIESLEFIAEVKRRSARVNRVLRATTVREQLLHRWGGSDS